MGHDPSGNLCALASECSLWHFISFITDSRWKNNELGRLALSKVIHDFLHLVHFKSKGYGPLHCQQVDEIVRRIVGSILPKKCSQWSGW
jgi:hypothetical protein